MWLGGVPYYIWCVYIYINYIYIHTVLLVTNANKERVFKNNNNNRERKHIKNCLKGGEGFRGGLERGFALTA